MSTASCAVFNPRFPHLVFSPEQAPMFPAPLPRGVEDYPSILALHGLAADYTEEELGKLDQLGRQATALYDQHIGGARSLANFIEIKKCSPSSWLTRRMTWSQGKIFSNGLDEGLSFLAQAIGIGREDEPTVSAAP